MPGADQYPGSPGLAATHHRRSDYGSRSYGRCVGQPDRGEPARAYIKVSEMLDALEIAAGRATRDRVRFQAGPNHIQDDVGMARSL